MGELPSDFSYTELNHLFLPNRRHLFIFFCIQLSCKLTLNRPKECQSMKKNVFQKVKYATKNVCIWIKNNQHAASSFMLLLYLKSSQLRSFAVNLLKYLFTTEPQGALKNTALDPIHWCYLLPFHQMPLQRRHLPQCIICTSSQIFGEKSNSHRISE